MAHKPSGRRASSFDDKRARIADLAKEPRAIALAELRRFLAEKNGYLAGEAANVARELDLRELAPDMASALDRLMTEGVAADKGCLGKKRVLDAMIAFEAYFPDVYLKAIRYSQVEPAFPRAADTAAPIRGLAAHALVEIDHAAALYEITPLLADGEPLVRAEAARALGRSGVEAASAPLHLKALSGDPEPDVLQACFEGLLRLAPARHLATVAAALDGDEGRVDAAALALGESRLPEAFGILRAAFERAAAPRERQSLAMAIGLTRSDEASRYLLSIVDAGPEGAAIDALGALALHRHDEALVDRVKKAVAARGSRRLDEAMRERFGR